MILFRNDNFKSLCNRNQIQKREGFKGKMMIVLLRFEKIISKKYQIGINYNPGFKLAYNIINQSFKLKGEQTENIDC